jgi:hypothetical protein
LDILKFGKLSAHLKKREQAPNLGTFAGGITIAHFLIFTDAVISISGDCHTLREILRKHCLQNTPAKNLDFFHISFAQSVSTLN